MTDFHGQCWVIFRLLIKKLVLLQT